jgi:hypothetical protein
MKVNIKQSALSIGLFGLVLLALVSVDDRVRAQVGILVNGGDGMSSMTAQAVGLGDALIGAARYQSIEHAPLMVFAAVSAVLVLFMVRT